MKLSECLYLSFTDGETEMEKNDCLTSAKRSGTEREAAEIHDLRLELLTMAVLRVLT